MSECCICSSEDRILYPVRNPVTGTARHVCNECVQDILIMAAKEELIESEDDLSEEEEYDSGEEDRTTEGE